MPHLGVWCVCVALRNQAEAVDDPTEDDESEGQEAEEGEEVAPDGARYPGFG